MGRRVGSIGLRVVGRRRMGPRDSRVWYTANGRLFEPAGIRLGHRMRHARWDREDSVAPLGRDHRPNRGQGARRCSRSLRGLEDVFSRQASVKPRDDGGMQEGRCQQAVGRRNMQKKPPFENGLLRILIVQVVFEPHSFADLGEYRLFAIDRIALESGDFSVERSIRTWRIEEVVDDVARFAQESIESRGIEIRDCGGSNITR